MDAKKQIIYLKAMRTLQVIKPTTQGKTSGHWYRSMSIDSFINQKDHGERQIELKVNGQTVALFVYKNRIHMRFIFAIYIGYVGGGLIYSRELTPDEIKRLSL